MSTLQLLAALAGLGRAWSADRPWMPRLTPPDRIGESYGCCGMVVASLVILRKGTDERRDRSRV